MSESRNVSFNMIFVRTPSQIVRLKNPSLGFQTFLLFSYRHQNHRPKWFIIFLDHSDFFRTKSSSGALLWKLRRNLNLKRLQKNNIDFALNYFYTIRFNLWKTSGQNLCIFTGHVKPKNSTISKILKIAPHLERAELKQKFWREINRNR